MSIHYHLDDKIALVTGGGQGLGKCICQALLESGATVVFLDLSVTLGKETEKELSQYGIAEFIQCNICDEEAVTKTVSHVAQKYGKLDIFVNNAGATSSIKQRFGECTTDELHRLFNTNVNGAFICMKSAINQMLTQPEKGCIVEISTALTEYVNPGFGPYAGAKCAASAFVRYAAVEYGADGIRINEVLPGSMNTPAMKAYEEEDYENYSKSLEMIPMRRIAEPMEVARAVVFLCSEDAGYITGAALSVGGGLSL